MSKDGILNILRIEDREDRQDYLTDGLTGIGDYVNRDEIKSTTRMYEGLVIINEVDRKLLLESLNE